MIDKLDLNHTEWFRGLLDFMLPPLCLGCGSYCDGEHQICEKCLFAIEKFSNPICLGCFKMLPDRETCRSCGDSYLPLYAFGNYTPPLRDIIIQFKFKGISGAADILADLLIERFGEKIKKHKAEKLVPVPLYASREKERGYNQAKLFAARIGNGLDIPVDDEIIFRSKRGKPQARLDFEERRENIKSVFSVPDNNNEKCKIILVDDVVTSGSTMREASRVLNGAGYKVVAAISIAHGI